jgi:hypothetical protein
MSFERIRKNINPGYSDEFLKRLPARFPDTLRFAKLRDEQGSLSRPGLARITKREEPAEDETDADQVNVSVKALRKLRTMNSLDEVRNELDQIIKTARTI